MKTVTKRMKEFKKDLSKWKSMIILLLMMI